MIKINALKLGRGISFNPTSPKFHDKVFTRREFFPALHDFYESIPVFINGYVWTDLSLSLSLRSERL